MNVEEEIQDRIEKVYSFLAKTSSGGKVGGWGLSVPLLIVYVRSFFCAFSC